MTTGQAPGTGPDTVRVVPVGKQRLRIAVRRGTGNGPPLLLCNGIGIALEQWAPFLEALDPALSVIRFDVPGVGGSPPAALPYRFPGLARLVTGMLTQLGHRRFDVLGVSRAVRSPSSSPSPTRSAAVDWCWWPPPRARS